MCLEHGVDYSLIKGEGIVRKNKSIKDRLFYLLGFAIGYISTRTGLFSDYVKKRMIRERGACPFCNGEGFGKSNNSSLLCPNCFGSGFSLTNDEILNIQAMLTSHAQKGN